MFEWFINRDQRRVQDELAIDSTKMDCEILMLEKLEWQDRVNRLEESQRGYAIANADLNQKWKKSEEMVLLLSNENAQLKAANLATLAKYRQELELAADFNTANDREIERLVKLLDESTTRINGLKSRLDEAESDLDKAIKITEEIMPKAESYAAEIDRLNGFLIENKTKQDADKSVISRRNAEIIRIHSELMSFAEDIQCPCDNGEDIPS